MKHTTEGKIVSGVDFTQPSIFSQQFSMFNSFVCVCFLQFMIFDIEFLNRKIANGQHTNRRLDDFSSVTRGVV